MLIAKYHRKAITGVIFCALLTMPLASNAIIVGPIHDPANMIENLSKQMADLENRISTEIQNLAKRELKKELKKAIGLEKSKREMTDQIAEARQKESLRNHEIANENMPVSGLCDNAFYTDENGNVQQSERSKSSILSFSLRGDYLRNRVCNTLFEEQKNIREEGLPNFEKKERQVEIAKQEETIDKIIEAQEDDGMSVDDIMPHTMTGLSQDEFERAKMKAKIIFAPIEHSAPASISDNKGFLQDTSKSMRALLPYQTQVDQISEKLRPADNIHSERESQIAFVEDFMDAENIETYSFRNMVLPSQVIREQAIMKAFLTHIALQNYKSSLDKEMLLTVRLLERLPN